MPRSSPQTERIVMLIQLLTDQPDTPRSLAEIARHLGVAKATCYPMVIALTDAGWLLRHPTLKTYRLGPAMIPIGVAAGSSNNAIEVARPDMRALADSTDLACLAFVRSGADLVVGEIIQPSSGRRRTLGLRLGDTVEIAPPLGAGIAAWYPPDQLSEWFALGSAHLHLGLAEMHAAYDPILDVIRRRGYAVECADQREQSLADVMADRRGIGIAGHRAVVATREAQHLLQADVLVGDIDPAASYRPISINAVVFGADRAPALALCVVDATTHLDGAAVIEIGDRVREAASRITAQIGGGAPVPDGI